MVPRIAQIGSGPGLALARDKKSYLPDQDSTPGFALKESTMVPAAPNPLKEVWITRCTQLYSGKLLQIDQPKVQLGEAS